MCEGADELWGIWKFPPPQTKAPVLAAETQQDPATATLHSGYGGCVFVQNLPFRIMRLKGQ